MILSASRRTDIPAFYSDWLLRRLSVGEVLVPNPWNPKQVGRVELSPDHVDCIVFWTKNPAPLLDRLASIDRMGYRYYFSFTVTAYDRDLERNMPPKEEVVDAFRRLADRIGPLRVDWRYDPVVVDETHPASWHFDRFGELCGRLKDSTERCVLNFFKEYKHIRPKINAPDDETVRTVAAELACIAAEYGLPVFSCAGKLDLSEAGIPHAACIDGRKIERILGCPIRSKKDAGQPKSCRCIESVDIGMYGTCPHGCVYCYANSSDVTIRRKIAAHDVDSLMLTGRHDGTEIVTDRTKPSRKVGQLPLF